MASTILPQYFRDLQWIRGEGAFKHLVNDYDIPCLVRKLEVELKKDFGITTAYEHVYSHLDNKEKAEKIRKKVGANISNSCSVD